MAEREPGRMDLVSEIYDCAEKDKTGCLEGAVISKFPFECPPSITLKKKPNHGTEKLVKNKENAQTIKRTLFIEHLGGTTMKFVGQQVWRGALFLADYVFHRPDIFKDKTILEVAAGVGLTSIVTAAVAKKVIISDIDVGNIFKLIDRNLKRNSELINADVEVKIIDFSDHTTIDLLHDTLKDVSIILVADIVYSTDLTDIFIDTIHKLMTSPPNKTMYVALEKRYIWNYALCYEHFLERLEWLKGSTGSSVAWSVEEINPDFHQYFSYERSPNLVLWRISAELK